MILTMALLAVASMLLLASIAIQDQRAELRAELERRTRERHPSHVRLLERADPYDWQREL